MTIRQTFQTDSSQVLWVYSAEEFTALDGANIGDALAHSDELIEGDVYQLRADSDRLILQFDWSGDRYTVSEDSDVGRPGATLHLDCCATFMAPNGTVAEMLLLVETCEKNETIAAVHVLPLIDLATRTDYALVKIDPDTAHVRFAETSCVSFVGGTRLTMDTGEQVAVQDLKVGDRVLTRDHGPQPIRWISNRTERAAGDFAPIRIAAGTLNNEHDLVVRPNHCLFTYQHRDRLGAGRAEALIKAEVLLKSDGVTRTSGGFVDYYQISFDRHEIIYAEGVAAETLVVDETTKAAFPAELNANLTLGSRRSLQVNEGALDSENVIDLIRLASAS